MKAISRRIRWLEHRSASARGVDLLVVVSRVGLALDADTCVQILSESGFVPTFGIRVVNLSNIPPGLNSSETKTYLQNNGGEICNRWKRHFTGLNQSDDESKAPPQEARSTPHRSE
jgi:hypothetical protein